MAASPSSLVGISPGLARSDSWGRTQGERSIAEQTTSKLDGNPSGIAHYYDTLTAVVVDKLLNNKGVEVRIESCSLRLSKQSNL